MSNMGNNTQGEDLDYTQFPNYINSATSFFVGSLILEFCISIYTNKKVYRFNDAMNSMSLGLCQEIVNILVKPINYIPYFYIWNNYSIIQLPADSVVTWVVALVGIDFGYYWFHRFGHRLNLGWATHAPHHSSDDYNLSTALRQGAFQYLFGWVFYLPLAFVCHPLIYSFQTYFNRLFQFWVHTQVIYKLGFLEKIFVTPSHHRVHHGSNPEYLDKNYGGIFIIWDRIFGSFEEEKETVRYGITTGLNSWSPIWGTFHYFVHMYELSTRLDGIKKLQVIYKGPEWHPAAYTPTVAKGPYVKYNEGSDLSYWAWFYIVLQFAFAVVLRKQLEAQLAILSRTSTAFLVLCTVWSLVSIGSILSKNLTIFHEHLRLGLSCAMLSFVAWQASLPAFLYVALGVWTLVSLLLFTVCNSSPAKRKANKKVD
eukprot:Phypoly_transcript_07034.p1 GENE.Phypoly_transcript_07034~~Phypoly_transcript_07034.p1  ORF type:complete len:425 (+),score=23.69 Phypoly_transcript_07034:357-1631(+)